MLKQSEIVNDIVENLLQSSIISHTNFIPTHMMIVNYLLDNSLKFIENSEKSIEETVSEEEHYEALWSPHNS